MATTDSVTDSARAGKRDFRFFLAGQTVSGLGDTFNLFALPLLVFRATGSELDLGALAALYYLPYTLFGLIAGAVADRYNRRVLMIGIDIARALLMAALGLLGIAHSISLPLIYVIIFLQSTLQIPYISAGFATVPGIVPSADLAKANTRFAYSVSVVQAVGPVLAGALVAVVAPPALLLVDAASFLVSAGSLALIGAPLGPSSHTMAQATSSSHGRVRVIMADVAEGTRYIWNHRVLRTLSLTVSALNLFAPTVQAEIFAYLSHLRASDLQIGAFLGAAAVGSAVLIPLLSRLRSVIPVKWLIIGSLLLRGTFTVALAFVDNYTGDLLLYACMGGLASFSMTLTTTLRQQIVPREVSGRVAGTSMAVAWSVIPLGTFMGGLAASNAGVDLVFGYLGCAIVAIAGVFATVSRRSTGWNALPDSS